MNRAEMVEQTVADIADYFPAEDEGTWRLAAEQIVATILPQITTAGELLALPNGSHIIVTVHNGHGWHFLWHAGELIDTESTSARRFTAEDVDWLVLNYGPLTVVWQP